ncbi:MAG TPA: hypothetical protein VI386_13005, partial [Candidatus Sulfotelmatobacter sp.]
MSRISPTAEGFRAAFRCPSVTLAEIVWRWAVGITAAVLVAFAFVEYLQTLPVTGGELLLLRTRQPAVIGQVIERILQGSLNRVVFASLVGALGLVGLWIIAASLGRAVTVRALLNYFADRENATDYGVSKFSSVHPLGGLIRLNFLKATLALAAILGLASAAILAGFASPPSNPRPELAFFLFLPLSALVFLLCWMLNWFLSLAGMFAVRDAEDAVSAIAAAVGF